MILIQHQIFVFFLLFFIWFDYGVLIIYSNDNVGAITQSPNSFINNIIYIIYVIDNDDVYDLHLSLNVRTYPFVFYISTPSLIDNDSIFSLIQQMNCLF